MIESHDHVGRLRIDVFEDDEVVDSEGLQRGHLPEEHLRGEDD